MEPASLMDSGVGSCHSVIVSLSVGLKSVISMLTSVCLIMYSSTCIQLSVSARVKMEGPAQLLILAPVMWGGQEHSVRMVSARSTSL